MALSLTPLAREQCPANTLAGVLIEGYRTYLHMPDEEPALAVLGLVVADRMAFGGRPPWLLINSAPGGGKTVLLESLLGLPRVHSIDKITEAGLLSASSKKDRSTASTGGVLRKIGHRGLLLNPDFTTILAMHGTSLKDTLSVMRRIYDGHWERNVGTDGGSTLVWEGRVSFISGVTPSIDRKYEVIADMGDRYCQIRLRPSDGWQECLAVANNLERGNDRSAAQSSLVTAIVSGFDDMPPPHLNPRYRDQIVRAATLAASARSVVSRDSYSHGVLSTDDAEMPTRITSTVVQIFSGMLALEVPVHLAMNVARRICLDSIPQIKRQLLERIALLTEPLSAGGRGNEHVPLSTIRKFARPGAYNLDELSDGSLSRALQDLIVHKVLERVVVDSSQEYFYKLTTKARLSWRGAGYNEHNW